MNLSGDKFLFLSVVRSGLWGTELSLPSVVAWDNLLQIAKEQALIGVAFKGVENYLQGRVGKKLILDWFSRLEKIKQKNDIVNKHVEWFARLLEKNQIGYRIVKGQVVAGCYPNALLRSPGDIDFWVSCDSKKRCEELIENGLRSEIKREESSIHVEFRYHGVQYELHHSLSHFSSKTCQEYFDNVVNFDEGMYVTVGETQVATLSPTLNALYIFIHLFQHLIHSGVGLRQMCDWMMWLHKYQEDIDRKELEQHLLQLALMRPYRVLGAILVDDLGLPENEFPFVITQKDRKRSRRVLLDIMELGNFGHNKENIKKLGFWHSMQTGLRMCKQGAKYIDLAPREILWRVPHMVLWYIKKKL